MSRIVLAYIGFMNYIMSDINEVTFGDP